MKTFTCIVLLFFSVLVSNAQSKGELGVYTEGAWFIPKEVSLYSVKNGYGIGGGLYYSRPIVNKFSASIGFGYRHIQNKGFSITMDDIDKGYPNYGNGYSYGGYGYPRESYGSWVNYPQHYLVVPLKVKYALKNDFFVQTGIEVKRLLNFDGANKRTETDWLIGFGSKLGELQWSLNYSQSFNEQTMGNVIVDELPYETVQALKSRMFTLNLSYPLWKSK